MKSIQMDMLTQEETLIAKKVWMTENNIAIKWLYQNVTQQKRQLNIVGAQSRMINVINRSFML